MKPLVLRDASAIVLCVLFCRVEGPFLSPVFTDHPASRDGGKIADDIFQFRLAGLPAGDGR